MNPYEPATAAATTDFADPTGSPSTSKTSRRTVLAAVTLTVGLIAGAAGGFIIGWMCGYQDMERQNQATIDKLFGNSARD